MPGDARAVGIVADRVDIGAEPCLPQQERDHDAGQREHHDRHRDAEQIALAELLEPVEPRAPLHDVELEQRGLPEAGEKQSRRQRREQRRHLGVGDQPAVDETEHRRQRKGRRERERERMAVLHHLQHQARRHGERRDQRNVDAAADHHDRHREPENAEHRHVLQQRQHIRRGQKAGQGKREDCKQRGKYRKHDSLLADVFDSHPGFSYAFFCRRCWRALMSQCKRSLWSARCIAGGVCYFPGSGRKYCYGRDDVASKRKSFPL